MSEVHRYQVVTMLSDAGNKIAYDPHGPWIVMAADHDRVTADQKEGIAKHWQVVCDQRAKIDALQQRLTAADKRNDEAIDLLRRARAVIEGGGWADLERDIAYFFKPAEPARCTNCDRATVEQCDDAGCGFLGAGNGAPE